MFLAINPLKKFRFIAYTSNLLGILHVELIQNRNFWKIKIKSILEFNSDSPKAVIYLIVAGGSLYFFWAAINHELLFAFYHLTFYGFIVIHDMFFDIFSGYEENCYSYYELAQSIPNWFWYKIRDQYYRVIIKFLDVLIFLENSYTSLIIDICIHLNANALLNTLLLI